MKEPTTSASASVGGENSLSLQLHSRDFLLIPIGTSHKDYRALTLDRLRRDSARVQAITARIALTVDGVKRSDLKPVADEELDAFADGIRGPIVSATSHGSGEYFSQVSIGSSAQPQYLVLDTRSGVTWVQCQPCSDCYQQSDPVFDPAASSSYASLSCSSQYRPERSRCPAASLGLFVNGPTLDCIC